MSESGNSAQRAFGQSGDLHGALRAPAYPGAGVQHVDDRRGLAAYVGIEVRELPDARPAGGDRAHDLDGASPQTIDQEVTKVIEGGRVG